MADFKTANLCGTSLELTSILSQIDDIFGDILAGLEDVAGSVISALESAMDALASALSALMPDISDLIPDINFQAEMTGLFGFLEGSLEYLAKLADLTLKFGAKLLEMGLNILDLAADGLAAFLKGLDICSIIPNLTINADGEVLSKENKIANPKGFAVKELTASETATGLGTSMVITKPVGLLKQRYVAPVAVTQTGLATDTTLY